MNKHWIEQQRMRKGLLEILALLENGVLSSVGYDKLVLHRIRTLAREAVRKEPDAT